MIDSKKIFVVELVVIVIILGVINFSGLKVTPDLLSAVSYNEICSRLFDFNSAVIIAFLMALISDKVFKKDDRTYKKIAINTTCLILVNTFVMCVSSVFGGFEIIFVIIPLIGNLIKFYDSCKNLLEIF